MNKAKYALYYINLKQNIKYGLKVNIVYRMLEFH